jgi:hypothetical protein
VHFTRDLGTAEGRVAPGPRPLARRGRRGRSARLLERAHRPGFLR